MPRVRLQPSHTRGGPREIYVARGLQSNRTVAGLSRRTTAHRAGHSAASRAMHRRPGEPAGKRAYYSPSMRRFAIPAVALVVAAALLALLAFGVAHQGTSTSIDASVARGNFPMAPDAHTKLPLLGVVGDREPRQPAGQGRRAERVRLVVPAMRGRGADPRAGAAASSSRTTRPSSASPTWTTRATPSSSSTSTTSPIR